LNNSISSPKSLFSFSEALKKESRIDNILTEIDDNGELGVRREMSAPLFDALTPLLKKRLSTKSIFARKEESSGSKAALDNGLGREEREEQTKARECFTPTEKLSTENSFTICDSHVNMVEAENTNDETLKTVA